MKAHQMRKYVCANEGHKWKQQTEFRINRMMAREPICHVRCSRCGIRTWMDEEDYNRTDEANGR